MRRLDSSASAPLDGVSCAQVRQRGLQVNPRGLRRRQSAARPHSAVGPSALDDDAPVDFRKLAVCTTVYSLVEGAVTYPYDLAKTRQQVSPPGSAVTQMSTTSYVQMMIRDHGVRSLYRGCSWNVLGGVPSEVAYYATYTYAKERMLQTHAGQQHPSAVFFLAGLVADAFGVLLWVPVNIVSQRLQMQGSHGPLSVGAPAAAANAAVEGVGAHAQKRVPELEHHVCRTQATHNLHASPDIRSTLACSPPVSRQAMAAECVEQAASTSAAGASRSPPIALQSSGASSGDTLAAQSARTCADSSIRTSSRPVPSTAASAEMSGLKVISRILQRDGPMGLWRGTGIAMASLAPSSAVWWLTHEQSKKNLARHVHRSEEHTAVLAASGTLAAFTATIASTPLDVLKTRIQCIEHPQSVQQTLRGVLSEAGWWGLYSGFMPRLAVALPRSVCSVLAYERAIAFCRKRDE